MKIITLVLLVLTLSACSSAPIYRMKNCRPAGVSERGEQLSDCEGYHPKVKEVK